MWKKTKTGFNIESRAIRMRELLGRVGNSMGGKHARGDVSKIHAHGLYNKFFLHASSAIQLRGGSIVSADGAFMFDIASLYVVIRAAVEAYLTFEYVFVRAGSPDESQLRFLAWWREGLLTRQKLGQDLQQATGVMGKEKLLLSENEASILRNGAFAGLSDKQKKAVVENGKWRFVGWGAIARKCELNEMYSFKAYSFLSSYAHSESGSVMQIRAMYQDVKEEEFLDTAISLLLIVCAKMIRAIVTLLSEAGSSLSMDDQAFLDTWVAGGSINDPMQ